MDKVVDIKKRIESKKQKRQLKQYRGKMAAIQKIIQCSSCHHRCAMCGLYLRSTDSPRDSSPSSLGYTFCESCRGEFEDFETTFRGKKPSDLFWHNKEWEKMWSVWLSYRRAITGFKDSPEFKLLLEDLDTQP
jgi:hypothetical protein